MSFEPEFKSPSKLELKFAESKMVDSENNAHLLNDQWMQVEFTSIVKGQSKSMRHIRFQF